MSEEFYEDGFNAFSKLLGEYSRKMDEDKIVEALEYGAEEFINLKALPKPRSQMRMAGYTHILDTMTTRKTDKEVEAGWGKYYGPMLERGTSKMNAQPHLRPTFKKNSKKYYSLMSKRLFG